MYSTTLFNMNSKPSSVFPWAPDISIWQHTPSGNSFSCILVGVFTATAHNYYPEGLVALRLWLILPEYIKMFC